MSEQPSVYNEEDSEIVATRNIAGDAVNTPRDIPLKTKGME